MKMEELMSEVEVIRMCNAVFYKSKLAPRFEIKISSSELVDALMEECNV